MSRFLSVRLSFLFLTIGLIFAYQNCTPMHIIKRNGSTQAGSSQVVNVAYTSDPTLESASLAIIETKCGACHQNTTSGGVGAILDVGSLLARGLIVAGDPSQGRLLGSMRDGSMPKTGALVTTSELTTLENWISSIKITGSLPVPLSPLLPGQTVDVDPALQNQAMQILNINCAGCHQKVTNGGIGNILDVKFLVMNSLVVVGDSSQGRLLGAIEDGSMPKGKGARVTASDLTVLKNWIDSMQIVNDVGQPELATRADLAPTFQGVFANIFQPKCIGCHGPVVAYDNKHYDNYTRISQSKSAILDKCSSGEMPQTPYPNLDAEELSALQSWINLGAPNN